MIFQVENKNVHASDAGQGIDPKKETIVFLHGSGMSHIVWSLTEIASILSFAMALRYSLDLDNEADALEKAVQHVLNDGLRTKDILSDGMKEISTSAMGDAIISKLQ